MKPTHPCLLLALALATCQGAPAAESSMAVLEQQFRTLPIEARRLTGPLFWLHGDESKDRLEMYVGKVAEGGNGNFTAESRPHKDWLGEGWYRDLAICLEAARKHNLQVWIFDEKWWPSGEVAGNVPERYGSKRLAGSSTNISGPIRFTATGFGGPRFVGAVAAKETGGAVEGASLVDLGGAIRDGTLDWQAPAGQWRIMKFSWAPHKSGARYLVDGASQESVDWYIRTVYQPHYDRFKQEFGKLIKGFFYDEPETHGDWGTEVMKVLAERGVDWKRALVAWKFQLSGEEQAAARTSTRMRSRRRGVARCMEVSLAGARSAASSRSGIGSSTPMRTCIRTSAPATCSPCRNTAAWEGSTPCSRSSRSAGAWRAIPRAGRHRSWAAP